VRLVGDILVAAGHDAFSGDKDGAIWTSRDGLTWTREPSSVNLGGPGGQTITTLVVFESRLIALGREYFNPDYDVAAWYADLPQS
jgi:hypothetical protein